MAPTRQDKDPLKEKQKNGNGKKKKNSSDFNGLDDDDNNFDDNVVDEEDEEGSDDGPIEIADNDEDYNDILKNSGNKPSDTDKDNQNKVQVNMEGIKDEEDENDIQKRFSQMRNGQGGGLGDLEVGSTNYMTEGFGFIADDEGECDETTEEDLIYLNDPSINLNTVDILSKFFLDL